MAKRFRRNLESVFSIDPDFSTRSLQELPDTVAAITPEGKALHWNRPTAHDAVKTPLSHTTASPDKIFGGILVIGDIPANLDVAHAALQSSGYNVVLAGSVNRAVALIGEIQPEALRDEIVEALDANRKGAGY